MICPHCEREFPEPGIWKDEIPTCILEYYETISHDSHTESPDSTTLDTDGTINILGFKSQ